MTVISHHDLRDLRDRCDRCDEILRAVEAGETFEITNHGRVVAVISPPGRNPLEELSYHPATIMEPFSEIVRVRRSESTADVMTELRGER